MFLCFVITPWCTVNVYHTGQREGYAVGCGRDSRIALKRVFTYSNTYVGKFCAELTLSLCYNMHGLGVVEETIWFISNYIYASFFLYLLVPTGLLALQGEDETGIFLRKGLQRLAVSVDFLRVDKSYKTGEVGPV